ncbi:Hsp20/alpha crystallin family protein [Aequorivita sp. H23M31]|uniref:Hsp20/alpha crystallin family protein n=1 Tax=Aequorivita ciconiae TaxID=2494375 RepID=A0A410G4F0_9FLAO|nr:Hsp20/alpha crystallin family protein [Aequorivita sp. H23M31]QAA82095.1 Hsp20/alpha crystallin family protein [Aequorivita sp. H23M31]
MNTLMNVPKNGGLTRTTSDRQSNVPTFSSWIDEFFNRDWPAFSQNFNAGITLPKVNIRETADAYFVEMAVPGMKKSDFNIELDNKMLIISNETREEQETKEDNYTRREFGYSSFKRSFSLPETVEEDKIKAEYQDGILSLQLPKREEAKQKPPRNIKIS